MKHVLILLTTLLSTPLFQNLRAQTHWNTLHHENGFTIELPDYFNKGLLVSVGTLQYFENSKDNGIEISVETFGNGASKELQTSYESDLQIYNGVTYKVLKPNWYVISGQDKEDIFYNKSIIKNKALHHLRITYPVHQKALMDAILPRISSSFK